MKFSANGRWLVLVSQAQVRVVDVADGRERASFPTPAVVDEVAIAADASVVVTVTGDKTLRAWRGSPMREVSATALPEDLAPGFTAIDAGRFLFFTHLTTRIGDRMTMRFWNLAAMSETTSQPVGQERGGFAATVCGVSGDGHLLAVNARGVGVILRNLENSAELGVVSESSGDKSCRFGSDGRYVAVLPDLGVWDIATQAEVSRIEAPASVIDAALSHDNRYLAMVSDKGEVSIAPLRPHDLIAEACARLANDISKDDWQRYVGNEPVHPACVAPN
jgi:hypothetical protein